MLIMPLIALYAMLSRFYAMPIDITTRRYSRDFRRHVRARYHILLFDA